MILGPELAVLPQIVHGVQELAAHLDHLSLQKSTSHALTKIFDLPKWVEETGRWIFLETKSMNLLKYRS